MKNIIKNLTAKATYYYNSIWNYFHFKKNVRKAKKLHNLTGKRYFVVPATEQTLMVVDNTYIDHYNRFVKKNGGKKININDLLRMAYFATSCESIVYRKLK